MRLLNLRINFYLLRTFCPHLGNFLCCFFFNYVSAKFHLWPSSGDLPRPRIDRNAESCNRIPSKRIWVGARGAADRGVESLWFQVNIVRR